MLWYISCRVRQQDTKEYVDNVSHASLLEKDIAAQVISGSSTRTGDQRLDIKS